jgi:hypothetical protein
VVGLFGGGGGGGAGGGPPAGEMNQALYAHMNNKRKRKKKSFRFLKMKKIKKKLRNFQFPDVLEFQYNHPRVELTVQQQCICVFVARLR